MDVGFPWSLGPAELSRLTSAFVPLLTSDGAEPLAALYTPAGRVPRTCFLVAHPRLDFTRFYAAPGLTAVGFGILCLTTRYLNNDSDAQHERMLLDLAAGMRFLRDAGAEEIVLIGNSGGGSLVSFYQSQAALRADQRISRTPSGDKIDLAAEDMPLAAGQVHLAVHVGEGDFMAEVIDPAVVDETNPMISDPELDMFEERNGRRPYPEASHYDPAWLVRYRAAQHQRCDRLDRVALAMIAERRGLRTHLSAEMLGSSAALRRFRMSASYLTVYRTLANPFYLDPAIDPSQRELGSCVVRGIDPIVGNYGLSGFARTVTPRAWLSNWSPTYTQTSMIKNVATYDIPSLFIEATGDTESGSEQFGQIVDACIATDLSVERVEGDHYLRPLQPEGTNPRTTLDSLLAEWASIRFRV